MNFFAAQLQDGEIVLPWMRLPCPRLTAAADGQIVLGIRPEDFLVGADSQTVPEPYRFEATVSVVEPMGSESLLVVAAGGIDIQVRLSGRAYPRAGAPIGLAVNPAELHLFDAAGGRSVKQ
jgi:multiple sugar transport system ATP-binding protein